MTAAIARACKDAADDYLDARRCPSCKAAIGPWQDAISESIIKVAAIHENADVAGPLSFRYCVKCTLAALGIREDDV